jgi:hypothetical protein
MNLDAEKIHNTVRRQGWAVGEAEAGSGALEQLKVELATAISTVTPYEYPFGEQRRLTVRDVDGDARFPATEKTMLEGPIAEVCALYGGASDDDIIVWSHEFTPDPEAIYGRPHFDRRHQLKIFLYLDDVLERNGPTHVATETPEHFHERWVASWRTALGMFGASNDDVVRSARQMPDGCEVYRSVNCEVDIDRSAFRPLVGTAGTVVFFDTSIAHFGGLVTRRSSRRTVRRHCLLD